MLAWARPMGKTKQEGAGEVDGRCGLKDRRRTALSHIKASGREKSTAAKATRRARNTSAAVSPERSKRGEGATERINNSLCYGSAALCAAQEHGGARHAPSTTRPSTTTSGVRWRGETQPAARAKAASSSTPTHPQQSTTSTPFPAAACPPNVAAAAHTLRSPAGRLSAAAAHGKTIGWPRRFARTVGPTAFPGTRSPLTPSESRRVCPAPRSPRARRLDKRAPQRRDAGRRRAAAHPADGSGVRGVYLRGMHSRGIHSRGI